MEYDREEQAVDLGYDSEDHMDACLQADREAAEEALPDAEEGRSSICLAAQSGDCGDDCRGCCNA